MIARRRAQRGERGAILILSAAGMVVALIASALAIDLGRLAQSARDDQKVADLAALDAIRGDVPQFQALAEASAVRNGFPLGDPGFSIVAVEGTKSGDTCVAVPGAGSVCVTVTSPHSNSFPFVGGRDSMTRSGVAAETAFGGFMLGSGLASIDTSRSAILNRILGRMLGGSSLALSAASWQGLVSGDLTLEALRTQLASSGFSVGTVDELLAAEMNMAELLTATAGALNNEGGAANVALATTLLTLAASVTNYTDFTLGEFMHIDSGAGPTALNSQLNVLQLLTASAQVANGNAFIDVPDIGISVGNTFGTKVRLQVIQPPQFYFGPVGGSVSTGQIDLTVTPRLNLPVTVPGLAGVTVTNDLPIRITAAGATGTLTAATCGAGAGITVTVDPKAFAGSATASLNARVFLNVLFLGTIPIADVTIPTTNVTPSTDGGPASLSWNFPSQFPPPDGTMTSKHVGSSPVGLDTLTQISAGTPTVQLLTLTPLPIAVGDIVTAVLNALDPVLALVDGNVLTPLLDVLGLDIGNADVTALALQCDTPALVG